MNVVFLPQGLAMFPLGSVAWFFLFKFFLVPANFSFLVKAAGERCLVDGLECSLDLPLVGVGGATGSEVDFSICPPGMLLGGSSPLGVDSAGGFGVSICPPGMLLDGGSF